MNFARFKAVLVACLTLAAAVLSSPTPGNASPVSSGWRAGVTAGQVATGELTNTVQWRRRGYYRRPVYRRRAYYRPRYYRPRYYRPYRVYRPCRIVNQRVWTGYGWAYRRVRVCR